MKKYPEQKYVEMGTCTAGAIAGWLKDYAKLLEKNYGDDSLIDQVNHISDWLFDKAENIDRINNQ